MKYLMEHEVGFDVNVLGFPSIMGCHAIVYQTSMGIFGYHVAGSSRSELWQPSANGFQSFVQSLGGRTPGSRLYGVTFSGNNQRGYEGDKKNSWKAELITFADTLNYKGRISGYDLSKTLGRDASAYVEYRVNGDKCDVFIRKWQDEKPNRVGIPADQLRTHMFIKKRLGCTPALIDLQRIVVSVSPGLLNLVHKEKLRG
jgi:hypothetical protein